MTDKTTIEELSPEEKAHKEAIQAGSWIFTMLAILTVGEFTTAIIAPPWTAILWLVAIWKAFYVVKDYMHIDRLFSDEEN